MNRVENLKERINTLYRKYYDEMLTYSKEQLIHRSQDIAFVQKAADLLYDDAEELPDCLIHHINKADDILDRLLTAWKSAESNRTEDERETLRNLFMSENEKLSEIYSVEELDDDLEM